MKWSSAGIVGGVCASAASTTASTSVATATSSASATCVVWVALLVEEGLLVEVIGVGWWECVLGRTLVMHGLWLVEPEGRLLGLRRSGVVGNGHLDWIWCSLDLKELLDLGL